MYRFSWLLLLCLVGPAQAHKAPSGMEYEQACCNEKDCGVVVKEEPDALGVRYYTVNHPAGIYFTYKEIAEGKRGTHNRFRKKVSEDGETHVCATTYGSNDRTAYWVYCLYLPAGS